MDAPSAVIAMASVASSRVGRDKSWEFVERKYEIICEKIAVSAGLCYKNIPPNMWKNNSFMCNSGRCSVVASREKYD